MNTQTTFLTATIFGSVAIFCGCDSAPPERGTVKTEVTSDRAVTVRQDFEAKLQDWTFVQGDWGQRTSDDNGVLAQTAKDRAFPLPLWKKRRFADVDMTVRFKPISGKIDASDPIR